MGPAEVVHKVVEAPLASTAWPSTATGPTLTPQMVAATFAATPLLTSLRRLTSPTATLISPSCCWFGAAFAGVATAPMETTAPAKVAAAALVIMRFMNLLLSAACNRYEWRGPSAYLPA